MPGKPSKPSKPSKPKPSKPKPKPSKPKPLKNPRVPRTRAGGTWTEARYWQFIRTLLRSGTLRWRPRLDAKRAARRPYVGPNPRQKYEYRCAACGQWFLEKRTQMDHLVPAGVLRGEADIAGFVRRLFCEAAGWRCLCLTCHAVRTRQEPGLVAKQIRRAVAGRPFVEDEADEEEGKPAGEGKTGEKAG